MIFAKGRLILVIWIICLPYFYMEWTNSFEKKSLPGTTSFAKDRLLPVINFICNKNCCSWGPAYLDYPDHLQNATYFFCLMIIILLAKGVKRICWRNIANSTTDSMHWVLWLNQHHHFKAQASIIFVILFNKGQEIQVTTLTNLRSNLEKSMHQNWQIQVTT